MGRKDEFPRFSEEVQTQDVGSYGLWFRVCASAWLKYEISRGFCFLLWYKKYRNSSLPDFLCLLDTWVSTFCTTDVISEAYINLGRICLSEWFSFCYFTVDSILYMRKIWAVPVRLLINLLNYLLSCPQNPNKKLYLILKVTFNFSPSLIINNLKYFQYSLLHFIWISCFRFIFWIWFTLPLVYLLFQLKCLTPGPVRFPPVNHFYYFSALWAGGLVWLFF